MSSVVASVHTPTILQFLKKHGQHLDLEIAAGTGISLANVRIALGELSARGDISSCSVIRFTDGKPIHGTLCRVAGSIPQRAPGPTAGPKPVSESDSD